MKVELDLYGKDEWPRCFYDQDLLCGDPKTGAFVGYEQETEETRELVRRGWHVANMCHCPSCPLRVALSTAVRQQKK
jgi:hypothetical protein